MIHFQVVAAAEGHANAAPQVAKITYTLSIYTVAQMKKDVGKRGPAKNTFLQLESTEPWDTVKAQLLVKVDTILKPETIAFEDYTFSFTVPRYHTKPTDLSDDGETYKFMIERALKAKDPSVTLIVEPKPPSKKVR